MTRIPGIYIRQKIDKAQEKNRRRRIDTPDRRLLNGGASPQPLSYLSAFICVICVICGSILKTHRSTGLFTAHEIRNLYLQHIHTALDLL